MFNVANYFIIGLVLINLVYIQLSWSYVVPFRSDSDDSETSGLYYGFSKVTVLNNTNFNSKIFKEQKEKLWLVEFYKHWCGYCIRFVGVMKAFATDVYGWRDVVKIGTIDCAISINNEICRNHGVMKVPSFRIFSPNSEENSLGVAFGNGSETSISDMRENLAQILKTYHNAQDKINGSVDLKLLRHNAIDQIWNDIPPTVMFIILVFEPTDSHVGSQVALDLSRTQEVRVHLVDPRNKNLSQLVGVEEGETGAVVVERTNYPTVSIQQTPADQLTEINDLTKVNLNAPISSERNLQLSLSVSLNDIHRAPPVNSIQLTVENFTREGLNKAVRKFLIDRGIDITPELPVIPIIHTNVSVDEIKEAIRRETLLKQELNVKDLSSVVFQMDLEAALVYALTREVSLERNITAEKLQALRNFVTVMIKYFPTTVPGKKLFTELKERELDNKESVCGEDFRNTFKELEGKYNPFMKNLEWVGCHGTIPSLRGYPCSLWTLFHTLVTLEELQDRNNSGETPEVLNAMTGYIKYFFSCSQCAEHFNKMAKTIPANVKSQRDAVLWLWKAHNNVNRRLADDATEDPRHHKVQFPTEAECPSCYNDDGSWNETQVFKFLSSMFTNISQLDPHHLSATTSTQRSINSLI